MNCRGVLDVLSEYLEGEAGKAVCTELEEHLAGCEKCRMHIDVMRRVITLYKKWRNDPIPKDVSQRLRQVFAAECAARLRTPPDTPGAGGSSTGRRRL